MKDKGSVKETIPKLQQLNGMTLKLWTLTSSHPEVSFFATDGVRSAHVCFFAPTFLDIASVMHNVRFEFGPAGNIDPSFEAYGEILDGYYSHSNDTTGWRGRVATLRTDEGVFSICAGRAAFEWVSEPDMAELRDAKTGK
jgi:hypothetical protein